MIGTQHMLQPQNPKHKPCTCRHGEEVTHCYDERYERPDFSLINSFFLPGHGEGLLASLDLPGGYLGGTYPSPDSQHFPMWSLEAEAARLEQRLADFPTTEAQVKQVTTGLRF